MSDTTTTSTVAVGDLVHPLTSNPTNLVDHYRDQVGRVVGVSGRITDRMPYYVDIEFAEHFPADEARRLGIAYTNRYAFTGWASITPKVGDRVRATRPQYSADPDWWAVANGRTGVVMSINDATITMRFDEPFTTDGMEWTSAGVAGVAVIEQAEVSTETTLTSSEPSFEERERTARRMFDRLCEALNEVAQEQDFCGQFEEWCEEVGIESTRSRERTFSVNVDLEYEVGADTIVSFLGREFGGYHDDVDSSVTVTSSVVISMTLSGEDPTECDSYEIDNALSSAGYSGYDSASVTNYNED